MIAGTLEIQMLAQLARLGDDMHKAQGMVGGAMRNIERSVASAKSVLASLGIGFGTAYFVSLIKGSIDAADHLGDLSKSTGIAVKDLAGLNLLAKQSGTDLDGLAKAINKMSVEMGKDPEKFRALGITAKTNKEALMQFADVFGQLPDINQRNAVAQAVFGKSWAELAPVLAEGGQRIGEIIDKGARLSGSTKEMTDDADRFNDQMAELNITLGATRNKMVGDMLPGLNRIAEAMREAARDSNIFMVALVGIGGAIKEAFVDSDLVLAQQRVDDLTRTLAHWQEKQKNARQFDDDHSIARFFLGEDFKKEIAQAEKDLSAALKRLEAEKARLMPSTAAAPAKVEQDKTAEAQRFLEAEKRRAEKLAAEKKAAAEIAAANKKAADEAAKEWDRFQENVQRNLGDVLYLGLQGKFRDIGDLFKQLMLRMTADAAAAQITKAMFGGAGMGAAMFGSAAVAATGTTAASPATAGLLGVGGAAAMTPAMIAGAAVVGGLLLAKYGFGMGNGRENVGGQYLSGTVGNSYVNAQMNQNWAQDGGWFGSSSSGTDVTALTRAQTNRVRYDTDQLHQVFVDFGAAIGDTSLALKAYNVNVQDAANQMGFQLTPQLERFRLEGETLAQTAARITAEINKQIDALRQERDARINLAVQLKRDADQAALSARSALVNIIDQIRAAADGIRRIGLGEAGSLQSFNATAALAGAGDVAAQGQLQGVTSAYLDAAKLTAASALDYARTVALVRATLDTTANTLDTQVTTAERQLSALDLIAGYTNVTATNTANTGNNIIALADLMKAYTTAAAASGAAGTNLAAETAAAETAFTTSSAAVVAPYLSTAAVKESARLEMIAAGLVHPTFANPLGGAPRVSGQTAEWAETALLTTFWGAKKHVDEYWSPETAAYRAAKAYYESLPSFASGTPYVQSDMTANIHRGEMVVDAQAASMMRRYGVGSGNEALVTEIRALRDEVARLRSSSESTAQSTRSTHNLLRNVTQDGNSVLTTAA